MSLKLTREEKKNDEHLHTSVDHSRPGVSPCSPDTSKGCFSEGLQEPSAIEHHSHPESAGTACAGASSGQSENIPWLYKAPFRMQLVAEHAGQEWDQSQKERTPKVHAQGRLQDGSSAREEALADSLARWESLMDG